MQWGGFRLSSPSTVGDEELVQGHYAVTRVRASDCNAKIPPCPFLLNLISSICFTFRISVYVSVRLIGLNVCWNFFDIHSYPDATPEELASGDNVCIICREEMHVSCKKLPCNHIFHSSCLRSWFQRQQTCPTCRMDVFRTQQRPQNQQPPQPAPPPAGLQMPQGIHGGNGLA